MIIVMSMDGIEKVNEEKRPRHFFNGAFFSILWGGYYDKIPGNIVNFKKENAVYS